MLQFVRACAPRDICLKLSRSMIQENLKTIWVVRPRLEQLLGSLDPKGMGVVTRSDFKKCILQATVRNHDKLSAHQVDNVVEAAAPCSKGLIQYRQFLVGLHVVDTANPE